MSDQWPIENLKAHSEITTIEGDNVCSFGKWENGNTKDLISRFTGVERLAVSLKLGGVQQVVSNKLINGSDGALISTVQKRLSDDHLVSHTSAPDLQQALVADELVERLVDERLQGQ